MKNRIFIPIVVAISAIATLFWLQGHPRSEEIGELRAAMDIGSGATNMQIAKVDPKTGKILEKLFQQSIPVPYQKHLEQSNNNQFDDEVVQQGMQTIQALKATAHQYHVKKIIGVATAAFRQASNAPEFAKRVREVTGVTIRIIDQDEEGILAFRGALAISPIDPQQAVVWDVGGGSMQLTTLTGAGTYLVAKGPTASIPFKNHLIQVIQNKEIKQVSSPNPINQEQMGQALGYARDLAEKVDAVVREKILLPTTQVIAVGSLFNYGIKPLLPNHKFILQKDLEPVVLGLSGKTDAELPGGSLAEVAVSNPTMVLGFMQGLQIQKLEILQVNNTDGALTYPAYWE